MEDAIITTPLKKRPRRSLSPQLQNLPQHALMNIVSHIFPDIFNLTNDQLLPINYLKYVLELRAVCKSFRNAVDAYSMALSMRGVSSERINVLLKRPLRRFSIRQLYLPSESLRKESREAWKDYLKLRGQLIHTLWFYPPCTEEFLSSDTNVNNSQDGQTLSQLFGCELPCSLRKVVTTSVGLIKQLARFNKTVNNLNIRLNISDNELAVADTISTLKPRFLDVYVIQAFANFLLRLKAFRVSLHLSRPQLGACNELPKITGLYEASLIDADDEIIVEQFVSRIEMCTQIIAVSFENSAVTGPQIERLAQRFTGLRRLRIYKCSKVTDKALNEVAEHCPHVEVELLFVREQFCIETLAKFDERITWGSCSS